MLLVGGGHIADGKVDALLDAGAEIHLVSPEVTGRLARLAQEGRLHWHARPFQASDVADAWIVVAATDDRAVNAEVAAAARAAGRLVNAVDDVPNCDFIATSVVRRGELQVSISTGGGSPAMARWLREQIDGALPAELGALLDALGNVRNALKADGPVPAYPVWRAAIEAVLRGAPVPPPKGTVCLVDIGSDGPDELNLRALSCIANADALVHDPGVHPSVLGLARPDVPRFQAGEVGTERLLVELARQRLAVVRLRAERPRSSAAPAEPAALRAAEIPFIELPGAAAAGEFAPGCWSERGSRWSSAPVATVYHGER